MLVLVRQFPHDARTWFAMFGETALWQPAEYLLAAAVDALNGANWQRSGNKSARRPNPWPRPGVTDPTKKRFGDQKMTVAEYEKRKQARRLRREATHADAGGGEPPSPSN